MGTHCKIVTKEPGHEKAHVVTGVIKEIDHDAGFLVLESPQGLGCISIKAIEAIKPSG